MRPIGFSTGAVAYSDFARALELLVSEPITCIELSALRFQEVDPLVKAIENLSLDRYSYISFHAPSAFSPQQERYLVDQLRDRVPSDWPIIVHPDTIRDASLWLPFREQLTIENMDQRKHCGRTVEELASIFDKLPEAGLCFDIGHARQCDTSMTQAYRILQKFRHKLTQIHVSEVNTAGHHDPISYAAKISFQEISTLIPSRVPVIIESRVSGDAISQEIRRVKEALPERLPVSALAEA